MRSREGDIDLEALWKIKKQITAATSQSKAVGVGVMEFQQSQLGYRGLERHGADGITDGRVVTSRVGLGGARFGRKVRQRWASLSPSTLLIWPGAK